TNNQGGALLHHNSPIPWSTFAQYLTDLKAWKQYRVKVKNINVSLAPDIEWPVSPDTVLSEA
ncbi:tail fiber assembly protein, partial [Yersinia thracica]